MLKAVSPQITDECLLHGYTYIWVRGFLFSLTSVFICMSYIWQWWMHFLFSWFWSKKKSNAWSTLGARPEHLLRHLHTLFSLHWSLMVRLSAKTLLSYTSTATQLSVLCYPKGLQDVHHGRSPPMPFNIIRTFHSQCQLKPDNWDSPLVWSVPVTVWQTPWCSRIKLLKKKGKVLWQHCSKKDHRQLSMSKLPIFLHQ